MNIPDEALEAAAKDDWGRVCYMDGRPWDQLSANTRKHRMDLIYSVVNAVAPHIAAQAYDEGVSYGLAVAKWEQDPGEYNNPGPYRNPYEEQE